MLSVVKNELIRVQTLLNNHPPPFFCLKAEAPAGIEGHRIAEELELRDIGPAVCETPGILKIDIATVEGGLQGTDLFMKIGVYAGNLSGKEAV